MFGGLTKSRLREWYYHLHISSNLSRNFIALGKEQEKQLTDSLINNVFSSEKTADSSDVQHLSAQMAIRLQNHRTRIIPWLNSIRPLKGLKILEIGCGNGTSTVALAEQGAVVTAVDIEQGLLTDAQKRCETYGVNATFHLMNATEVAESLGNQQYDLILFFAVLEHMTYSERLTAIRQTYDMLSPGGLWCIIGTPNRLHFFDSHTALLPFFYWLPDELAIQYASRSPRAEFGERFEQAGPPSPEQELEFARWGRGMSYHEVELALGPLEQLQIVSSLGGFLKKRDFIYKLAFNNSTNGRYGAFLRGLYPNVHEGFFDPFLDIAIQK